VNTASTFRAFRNRNYALYFAGQGISQIGTWMQRTAVSWVVYTLTHSAFMLGLTVFASQFPSFVLSLYGGLIADRYNRYHILLITQSASMLQAILLAIFTLSGHYTVAGILGLSVLLGIVNAFDVPARQPLVHELVSDKADLPNALALNSSVVSLARIIGPALSGLVLVGYGAGICFLLNAISFVAVISSLLLMKLPAYTPRQEKKNLVSEFTEGFAYLKQTPQLSMTLLLIACFSLLVLPFDTLLPVFAKVIFHGDASTYGYLTSFMGLGAICGTVFLASLKKGTDLKRVLLVNTIVSGICLILFSHITNFPLALFVGVLAGIGTLSLTTICITIIQVHTAQHMRGRVMSYVALAFFGMLPLGSLLTGMVSHLVGAPDTLFGQGILALLIAVIFSNFLRRDRLKEPDLGKVEEAEETALQTK
jgi:MFS family permease